VKVVDSAQMAQIDHRAQAEYAFPSLLLMENAAGRMVRILMREVWPARLPDGPVLFLAGKGNNGGDALAMARQCRLAGLRRVSILLAAGSPRPGSDPEVNLKICRGLGMEVLSLPEDSPAAERRIAEAEWILDGLSGTGLKGALKPPLAALVERVNAASARVVAIDLPSVLGDEFREGYPCVRAEYTLTVGLPKLCLYLPRGRLFCGHIRVATGVFPPPLVEDPAIPGEILLAEPQEFFPATRPDEGGDRPPLPPEPPLDTYKTRRGHLAVFAGSAGTTGAAWLCSGAAARSRAGLVTLFADRQVYPAMVPGFHSVMVRPWDPLGSAQALDLGRYTALLAGPGWGVDAERARWLEALLAAGLPGVLDADGLTLLAGLRGRREVKLAGRWVLTPHPGEFSALSGVSPADLLADPLPPLLALSSALQAVVVLKGHVTLVGEPGGRYWVLDGMNPALATGGSGDVLAGVIGGFLAGGLPPEEAATLGVLTHSRAAVAAYRERGWFLSEDLLPYLSAGLRPG
jgi:NAD(P)H-hydrate epimerase